MILRILFIFVLCILSIRPALAEKSNSITSLGFSIQMGAFSDVKTAEIFTTKLQSKGIEAFFFRQDIGDYAVRFGDFASKDEAITVANWLVSRQLIDRYDIATLKNNQEYPSFYSAEAKIFSAAAPATSELVLGFKDYLESALNTNPSHLINSADFKKEYARSVANLQGYSFYISFDPAVNAYYDNRLNYGADVAFNISKTLYDGGKKQILEKELEIVRNLTDARLIDSENNTTLIAVNIYTTLYYLQEEFSLLKHNFSLYQDFMSKVENSYLKGIRISSFDYYSSKSLALNMEKTVLRKKAELLKAETAFRQFAKINTDQQIRLIPLSAAALVKLEEIEKTAVLDNSSIKVARLQKNLQLQKIDEINADRGVTVKAKSGLGMQFGSTGYTGTNSSFGTGTTPIANIGITASFPIFDGGARRSNILAEEIEALKQKMLLQKTTDDVIKLVSDIYADYMTLEKDLEITRELVDLNRKRTSVAVERFDKGLEEYRSVREAWNDSILTEIEAIRQNSLLNKLLVDMTILSGKKLFDL